ncbi:hypothetical protein GCM10010965_22190 [Caldalkalibacillus thermarum]|uniref:hypothetical protein n=1 Tax=Caldalkalibacillus thermarum TaxID=296745 RepID=UPI00166F4349|nr:hypothetical protein [Caldalkalibacillus thermarum]GGK28917.1 hypothetical protein GCM10010965_22190 [Caldalkalibacillus thermarum]
MRGKAKGALHLVLILSIAALLIYGKLFWPPPSPVASSAGQQRAAQPAVDKRLLDYAAIEAVSGFEYQLAHSEGLQMVIGEGNVSFDNGVTVTVDETTVEVADNGETHIMLDMHNLTLSTFSAPVHRGGIQLATVIASGGEIREVIQNRELDIPATRIPRTKEKLWEDNTGIRVAVFGSSLLHPLEHEADWADMIFNPAYNHEYEDLGLNLSKPNVVVHHYTGISPSAHFGLVQMGQGIREDGDTARLFDPAYDLAIVGYDVGSGQLAVVENLIRQLRQEDIEVILVAVSSGEHGREGESSAYQTLNMLADIWGTELVDPWGYLNHGETQHAFEADGRLSLAGQQALAQAIRSVLNKRKQRAEEIELPETRYPVAQSHGQLESIPAYAEVMFEPLNHSGEHTGGQVDDLYRNPALRWGERHVSNYIIELRPGQAAYFKHPRAMAVDLLVDLSSQFTADLKVASDAVILDSVSGGKDGWHEIGLIKGISPERYSQFPFLYEIGFNIEVTSGTMKLVGTVFYVEDEQ